VGQDGEMRKQTSAQKQTANHPEPSMDVKPTESDISAAPG